MTEWQWKVIKALIRLILMADGATIGRYTVQNKDDDIALLKEALNRGGMSD